MRAADRTEYIVQALMEGGAMYEDGAKSFLAEHDANRHAELLGRVERYRIAWQMARTRARSTGGAADRYAARAHDLQTALQETVFAVIGMQMERDAARVNTLTEITHRLSSRATLYGDSTTVNRVIKDLLNLADEQPGKGTGDGTQPPAGEPTQRTEYALTSPEYALHGPYLIAARDLQEAQLVAADDPGSQIVQRTVTTTTTPWSKAGEAR